MILCLIVVFNITGVHHSDDENENWIQYGGYGGYSSYYKNRNDYHSSLNHWRLSDIPYRPYYGVKQYSDNTDFDYYSLGKGRNHGYGYGSWKGSQWNISGNEWSGHDHEIYYDEPEVVEVEGRSDDSSSDQGT